MTKPTYKIPSIHQINRWPANGLRVASLFAGGGGSSTGWRWAGFKVVYANEFMPYAADCYQANHPRTKVDRRDIKLVQPADIGEVDILDGSPPCQGFSIANQNRLKRKAKTYENGISQVNEDLFFEYIRILRGLKPKVFVAENVRGLTIGGGKKVFGSYEMDMFINQDDTILHALMDSGYIVRWQILNAADYGTPQSRPRVFIIGVRKDLNMEPVFPVKLGYQYSVLDALPHLGDSEMAARAGGFTGWQEIQKENPSPSIMSEMGRANPWKVKDSGCKTFIRQGQKGNFKNEGLEYNLERPLPTILSGVGGGKDQFRISVQHGSHGQIVWKDASEAPAPCIMSGDAKRESDCMPTGMLKIGYGMGYAANQSFPRNVQKSSGEPIATIQKMQGVAGGAPVSVTDGETTRKFTIAELKRLGGFPDDYDLSPAKSYSRQWEIIGNSVCPPQMKAIASCLYHQIFRKL